MKKEEKYYYVTIMRDSGAGIRYKQTEIFVSKESMIQFVEYYREHIQDLKISWIYECGTCKVQKGRIVPNMSFDEEDVDDDMYEDNDDDEDIED